MKKPTRPAKAPPKKSMASRKPAAKKAPPKKRTPAPPRVTFRLHAPHAQAVHVAGSFCDWQPTAHPLKNGKGGVWTARLALPPGRHEYRFVVDGVWHDDPQCGERVPNPYGAENCVLHVLHEVEQAERGKVAGETVA